jgi:hypothetical protein
LGDVTDGGRRVRDPACADDSLRAKIAGPIQRRVGDIDRDHASPQR